MSPMVRGRERHIVMIFSSYILSPVEREKSDATALSPSVTTAASVPAAVASAITTLYPNDGGRTRRPAPGNGSHGKAREVRPLADVEPLRRTTMSIILQASSRRSRSPLRLRAIMRTPRTIIQSCPRTKLASTPPTSVPVPVMV